MQIGFLLQREGTVVSWYHLVWPSPHVRNRIDGAWITFTGDQLGALFAARILELFKASGKPIGRP